MLLAGFGEVVILLIGKLIWHRYLQHSLHVIWMAPAADLMLFGVPALTLWLGARYWPTLGSLVVVSFTAAFVGYISWLLHGGALSLWAVLLLGAGLAVQTARLIAAHPRAIYRLVQATLGWTRPITRREEPPGRGGAATESVVARRDFLFGAGVTLPALAAGVGGWQWVTERRALARLPVGADTPNVLLIVLDTVRAQSLSLYGRPRPTSPQLERFAQTSVRFDRAIATAPWTLPSHASMFTGRLPHEHRADWYRPLDKTYPSLAEVLGAHGYITAGFVSNTLYCQYETGLDRGFAHYEDYALSPEEVLVSSSVGRYITNSHNVRQALGRYGIVGRKSAEDINRAFLTWLSGQGQRRHPFFAFLNYCDAHEPYLPPKPFDGMFGSSVRQLSALRYWDRQGGRLDREGMPPEQVQAELDAYEGAVAYLDQHLGLLFDELDERGLRDTTLVIVTSDHGEHFNEHGLFGHGNSLYRPLLQVPLLLSFPSQLPSGLRVSPPVSLRELPATVTDLMAIRDDIRFPGQSLARYWNVGDPSHLPTGPLLAEVSSAPHLAKASPAYRGDMKSLIMDHYQYVLNADGTEELYDWGDESGAVSDLSTSVDAEPLLGEFRRSLRALLVEEAPH